MIEFNGYLTGNAQKFFCNQIVKLQQKFMIFIYIPGFFLLFWFSYLIWGTIIEPSIVIFCFVLAALTLLLPKIQTKKEKEKITPQKVYIENEIIISQSNALIESRYIEDVKEVRDYGEFYYLTFPFGKYSYRFVCQKNLLSQGTLDDFESLFEGKIVRKTQKSNSSEDK